MAGLRDGRAGQLIKKPVDIWASDPALIRDLHELQCTHDADQHYDPAHSAQVWPWELATRVAAGVSAIVRRSYTRGKDADAYASPP